MAWLLGALFIPRFYCPNCHHTCSRLPACLSPRRQYWWKRQQAVLKRGLPIKLVIDNGPAYRAKTLQAICARLGIHLVYCRPYAPEGKGKLERWHRSFRDQFLSELDSSRLQDLSDLNARLWAWLETVYHRTPHSGLEQQTPLQRYQQDLPRVRTLGARAARLDELFYHRTERKVRAIQGCISAVLARMPKSGQRRHRLLSG